MEVQATGRDHTADTAHTQVIPRHKTRGEKLFDTAVYGVVNGVGNFLITIPLAYWGLHGGASKQFETAREWLLKNHNLNPQRVKEVLDMAATSLGGWLMVVPVYVAEKFRKPAVDMLNQRFGSEQDKAADIPEPHKQTWGSLLLGRLGAMATVMVAFRTAGGLFPKEFTQYENSVADKLCKAFGKATHTAAGIPTKAYRYGQMAALDVFATTSATILLYSISRFVARKRDDRREHRAERAALRTHGQARDEVAEQVQGVPAATATTMPETVIAGEKVAAGIVAPEANLQVQGAAL